MIQGNTASTVPWLEDSKPLLFNGLEKFARQPTKRPRLYYARLEIGMPSNPHPGYGIINCNPNVSYTHHHHHHHHHHPTVSITVVSDFNRPRCCVAHKEVQSALTQARISHPNTLFTVEYHPFQLDPTLPTEKPMCWIACYKAKFGEEKMKMIGEALRERGRRVGIDFHMAGKVRQTTNTHRLALKAWLCGGEAAQVKMVDALFAAYFERETDIGCYNFLSKAAESTGSMTYDQAQTFLKSDKLKDEVQCLIRHSVLREIKGFPFTVISNQWAIQGAETAESFYRAFEFAANATESQAIPFMHPAYASTPSATTMSTPDGLSGTAPSCKPKLAVDTASVTGDHVSEILTQSGTSGGSTPTKVDS